MSTRLFFMIFFPFLFLQVLFSATSGGVVVDCSSTTQEERSPICSLIDPGSEAGFSILGQDLDLPFMTPAASFFASIATALAWDYPYFEGDWNYFRLFLLYPLSAVVIFGFAITFLPMAINAAGIVVKLFRGG